MKVVSVIMLVMPFSVVSAQLNRTCVNSNATRLINNGFNPCEHTEVTEGNVVTANKTYANPTHPPVVLAHGMFHGAWYWEGMQAELSNAGYDSHAFTFQETNANTKIYELSAALYAFILTGAGTGGALTQAPVIVGHSTAGHIVQHFMLTHALLLPAEIRPHGMVLMGSGCNDQPCDTDSDAAVQARLNEMMADGSFNINTAYCNTDMSKAIFFGNGTNSTDVSGGELDMAEYACKLRNEQGGAYCTYCVTPDGWEYTTTPAEVSKNMPTLVQQSDLDIFNTAINSTFMIDHLVEQWVGATALKSAGQAHVNGDPGWKSSVAAPLVGWLATAVPAPNKGTQLSTIELAGVGIGICLLLILIVLVAMHLSKRRARAKYQDIPGYSDKA